MALPMHVIWLRYSSAGEIMKTPVLALTTVLVGFVCEAPAASYSFVMEYQGADTIALLPGSDDPLATVLLPGDSFTWDIIAEAGEYWHVTTDASIFALMAFPVDESGERVGSYDLTISLNGAPVLQHSENDIDLLYVHLGTNTVDLPGGLDFDRMYLSFTLSSALWGADIVNTTPTAWLPIFGTPESNQFAEDSVEYRSETVPDAGAGVALLGATLLACGFLARRWHC